MSLGIIGGRTQIVSAPMVSASADFAPAGAAPAGRLTDSTPNSRISEQSCRVILSMSSGRASAPASTRTSRFAVKSWVMTLLVGWRHYSMANWVTGLGLPTISHPVVGGVLLAAGIRDLHHLRFFPIRSRTVEREDARAGGGGLHDRAGLHDVAAHIWALYEAGQLLRLCVVAALADRQPGRHRVGPAADVLLLLRIV